MTRGLTKDEDLLQLLERLRGWLAPGAFEVVDHWESDLCAVGIASPRDNGVLAYLSTFGCPVGRCDVELERPPRCGSDLPYEAAGRFANLEFGALLGVLEKHLLER